MNRYRFAPSPTGHLHLGHAYSAWLNWQAAHVNQGIFLIRIEDIDWTRCKQEYTQAIIEDLTWLGFVSQEPIQYQSTRIALYQQALEQLKNQEVLYPCACTRSDQVFHQATLNNQPCVIKNSDNDQNFYSLRLNLKKATKQTGDLYWQENQLSQNKVEINSTEDPIIARKDIGVSYHLAVCVDDHLQKITHIIRGQDLLHSTPIHRILQALLKFNTPHYTHHALLYEQNGQKYSKTQRSLSLRTLKEKGLSAQDVLNQVQRAI